MGYLALFEAYKYVKDRLDMHQAKLLCETILNKNYEYILEHKDEQVEDTLLLKALKQREEGRPLQYILGEWEFYGRSFFVGEGVLIPRQDTETLCDTALKLIPKNAQVIDLCAGSGCIPITLKYERTDIKAYALEKSQKAYDYLVKNISRYQNSVQAIRDDVLSPECIDNLPQFDIITSNPPYLTKTDMQLLQKEVRFEPEKALYGDDDGLLFYKQITKIWKKKLKSNGKLIYEIGINQQEDVEKIMRQNGFTNICFVRDLCGIVRVIYGSI